MPPSADWPWAPPTFPAPSTRLRAPRAHIRMTRRCTSSWPARSCSRTAPDEAFAEFVAALLIDPQDAGAHAGIGRIHLDAGRDADAVDALRRAMDLRPANTDARYALATALDAARPHRGGRAGISHASSRRSARCWLTGVAPCPRRAEGRSGAAGRGRRTSTQPSRSTRRALALGADPAVYGRLADLYSKVGRALDAARARAIVRQGTAGTIVPVGSPAP